VIGSFSTKFSVAEKTRNDNLKLLASKIDGYVLQPGQEFSFNDLTGMRTLEDGFKMAHVILAGEMVDGMAGGSCQISTTLHGAAFFGGLDILRSTPHSRPSTYVALGLDATVVAGQTDLKLRNPYDFPVVIHYRVARGVAYVELLGKEKPFTKVEFEREIAERLDFETVTREDNEMPVGSMVVDQLGYPGYKVNRTRRIYKGRKVIRTDKWKLQYRPVVEYARIGINPNPNLPAPEQKKKHGPKPAEGKFKMVR
jgi:vancomycin resistance protein YoaR